jgi:hypothetical protein
MAESQKTRTRVSTKVLLERYKKVPLRTEPLSRLVDFIPGTEDPSTKGMREPLLGPRTWEVLDARKRNQTVGFLRREGLRGRHLLAPPAQYHATGRSDFFDKPHAQAIKRPTLVFRYKEIPMTALAPENALPVTPLVGMVPRLKSTPTEDLAVILNSRLFHMYWKRLTSGKSGSGTEALTERLAGFQVLMLTKRTGGPFRAIRDEILKLASRNSQRLAEMNRVQDLAEAHGVPLSPLGTTEGIIREINVPRAVGEVSEIKRRGPVVIFRRGSTIVTTTEESATYLELWLKERFDQLREQSKEQLEEFIQMPVSTALVVVVLQQRARIEADIDRAQSRIEELQREAEDHLYRLYKMSEPEREYLRSAFS